MVGNDPDDAITDVDGEIDVRDGEIDMSCEDVFASADCVLAADVSLSDRVRSGIETDAPMSKSAATTAPTMTGRRCHGRCS
jgi:hypothetical protein